MLSPVKPKPWRARLWFCPCCEWLRLAVSFRPVSACALGFSVLGIPVCLTAVWNPAGGFRSAVGRRLYPEPRQVVVSFHCSHISFALPDPIQGHSATSLRTDDLFYPATARGGLVFTQPCLLQEPAVRSSITWHPSLQSLRRWVNGKAILFQSKAWMYCWGVKKPPRRRFFVFRARNWLWAGCR